MVSACSRTICVHRLDDGVGDGRSSVVERHSQRARLGVSARLLAQCDRRAETRGLVLASEVVDDIGDVATVGTRGGHDGVRGAGDG